MRTFQQVGPLRTYLRGIRQEGKSIGFVPTMGALHEGHLALFRRAKSDCDLVVASIFVNPLQFGPHEDLQAYPRDLNRDLHLASVEGVDALFHPAPEEVYPSGYQTTVRVSELSSVLEGSHRPGHFDGVATVVTKLLNIVLPDQAFFGQKDYQQLLIVERLVRDLNLNTVVKMMPTVRDADGLALSSRNAYLTSEECQAALVLSRALRHAQEMLEAGNRDPDLVQTEMERLIAQEPLTHVEYAILAHPDTLAPIQTLEEASVALLAVRVGRTRLIDNAFLAPDGIPHPRHRLAR